MASEKSSKHQSPPKHGTELPNPRRIFRKLTSELVKGELRERREDLSEIELEALSQILENGSTDEKYTVKEIINETKQLKNPHWFE